MNTQKILNYFNKNNIDINLESTNNIFIDVHTLSEDIFTNIAKYIRNARYEVNVTFYNWYTETDPAKIICKALEYAISKFVPSSEYPYFVIRFMFSEHITQKGYIYKELQKAFQLYNLGTLNIKIYLYIHVYYTLGSFHFKYITIDGEYSLITGANIQNKFNFIDNKSTNWLDIGIILRGEITTFIIYKC